MAFGMSGNTVTDSEINIVQRTNQPVRIARLELSEAEPMAGRQSGSYGLIFYRNDPIRDVDLRSYVVVVGSAADRFLTTGLQLNVQVLGYGEPVREDVSPQVHPQVRARIEAHKDLLELLCQAAKRAARLARVDLCAIRIFPDCSHEYDASKMTVFEVAVRALTHGRDAYWNAVEPELTMLLSQLPEKEQNFFHQHISFEVAEE